MDEKKRQEVKKVVAELQKSFGEEAVNFLGNDEIRPIPRVPSGCLARDEVTGGGYPLGRIIEVFGRESSGKTTTCCNAIASFQKAFPDKFCGFIDSEFSFDPQYAQKCGVDVSSLVIAQPDDGTDALAILEGFVRAGFSCVVTDSVAAMAPRVEMENDDYGHNSIGAQAKMFSQGLRKLTPIIGRYKTTVIFTNQIREKIGVMYGNPETTPGGLALRFFASIRLKLTPAGAIEGNDKVKSSVKIRVEAVKNKTAPPFKKSEFIISFGQGIDNDSSVVDAILKQGLIQVKGAGWYSYDGRNVAQGIPKLKQWFEANPDIYRSLREQVLSSSTVGVDAGRTETADDTEVGEV